MPLQYANLDPQTRPHMAAELNADVQNGRLYVSPRLTEEGAKAWAGLIGEAIASHDDAWLAATIRQHGLMKSHEERRKPKGGVTLAQVPVTAPDTLAEGEFNRFYVRGLCLRAIQDKVAQVVAYRARHSENPRAESEAVVGKHFDPSALLADLRVSQGVDPSLGVPPGPNSGLSVRIA